MLVRVHLYRLSLENFKVSAPLWPRKGHAGYSRIFCKTNVRHGCICLYFLCNLWPVACAWSAVALGPCSLFTVLYSLFSILYSLFPVPCFLNCCHFDCTTLRSRHSYLSHFLGLAFAVDLFVSLAAAFCRCLPLQFLCFLCFLWLGVLFGCGVAAL